MEAHNNVFKKLLTLTIFLIFILACNKEEQTFEKVTACFKYDPTEVVAGEVQFINCSENATDYLWDFGDGTRSDEKEPSHQFGNSFPYNVKLIAYNEDYSDTIINAVYDEILVKKPNIYLYPKESINICVTLSFPLGGHIVQSIPNYNDGWCVTVDENGRINNQYDFLFYESKQPNLFQNKEGWCIEKARLELFFNENMLAYNFSDKEIKDFNQYWIPLLKDYDYFLIYPQTKDIINKTNQIEFSIVPDNIYRLFYSIKGVETFTEIITPEIHPFDRTGFYVVEWGGMMQ